MPYTLNNHFYSTVRPSTYVLSYDLQLEYCYRFYGQILDWAAVINEETEGLCTG